MRLAVDWRASCSLAGTVCKYLALPFAAPALVAVYYGEDPLPFLVAAAAAVAVGVGLERLDADPEIRHREAFLLVGLAWLVVPLLGTIPYLVSGQGTVAHPTNALFESMSGFTTTGATVMGEISVERHSRALLLWRQLTQWLGGMGIVVLMVAILPDLSVGGAQLVKEEAPGIEVEKLTPRIRQTAAALWKIYAGLTVACIGVYYGLHLLGVAPNMGVYNAVAHGLTTLPTGGFSPEARSIEAFSPAVQWAVIPFMVAAGTNFALFWYVLRGEFGRLVGNAEFRSYLLAMAAVGLLVVGLLFSGVGLAGAPSVAPIPGNVERSLRQGLFQVVAIVTTTGYASMDFNTWSDVGKLVLLFGMFLGGSAGSAAGSVKILRWYVVGKSIRRELYTTVHPEAVRPIRLSGTVVDEDTVREVAVFTLLFVGTFAVSAVALFVESHRAGPDLSALEATSVAAATLGNVGPGFGVVGPMNGFTPFSVPAKLYMVALMWAGRLELLSVVVLFTPAYWRR
ncbi:MAG: TrkH family potassium uptake protein [Halobacteriaceae archaeon]